jgi:hypothetical protein
MCRHLKRQPTNGPAHLFKPRKHCISVTICAARTLDFRMHGAANGVMKVECAVHRNLSQEAAATIEDGERPSYLTVAIVERHQSLELHLPVEFATRSVKTLAVASHAMLPAAKKTESCGEGCARANCTG